MATQYTAGLATGQVLTAATMNSIGAAWETFNPTITQGVTLTKTVISSKYSQINKTIVFQGYYQFTSAGTAGQRVSVALPFTNVGGGTFSVGGSAMFYRASINRTYLLVAAFNTGNTIQFFYDNVLDFFGAAPAVTVANSDYLAFTITYEAA